MIIKLLLIFMLLVNTVNAREMSSQDFSKHINQLRSQISTSAVNNFALHSYTSQLISQIASLQKITTPHRNYSVDLEWAADVVENLNNENEPAKRQILLMNMIDTLEGLGNEIEYAGAFSGIPRPEMDAALQRAIDKTVRVRVARHGAADRDIVHTTRGGYVMEGEGEEVSLSTAEAVDQNGNPTKSSRSSSSSGSSSGSYSQSQATAWYNNRSPEATGQSGSSASQQGLSQRQEQTQSQQQQQNDTPDQSQQAQPGEQQQPMQQSLQQQQAPEQAPQQQTHSPTDQTAQQQKVAGQSQQQQSHQQSNNSQTSNQSHSQPAEVRRPRPARPSAPTKPPPQLPKARPPRAPTPPAAGGLFYYLFMGLVILGVITTIGITIYKFLTKVKEEKENEHVRRHEDELPPDQLTTDTLLDKAMRAAAKENYHEAIRLLTIGALIILEHQRVISYKDSLTNGEYLKKLLVEKELHAKFKKPMSVFDKLIYGFQQPDRKDFYMFRDFYLDLENMQR